MGTVDKISYNGAPIWFFDVKSGINGPIFAGVTGRDSSTPTLIPFVEIDAALIPTELLAKVVPVSNGQNEVNTVQLQEPAAGLKYTNKEELQTTPISPEKLVIKPKQKKARRTFVSEDKKDEKYHANRRKNTAAVRKYRETKAHEHEHQIRRLKYLEIEVGKKDKTLKRVRGMLRNVITHPKVKKLGIFPTNIKKLEHSFNFRSAESKRRKNDVELD